MYRAYHQRLGQESIQLHDAVAMAAVLDPTLFEYVEMSGDVETRGELTLGTTVFDRRHNPQWRPNMDVALRTDPEKVIDLHREFAGAGRQCTTPTRITLGHLLAARSGTDSWL